MCDAPVLCGFCHAPLPVRAGPGRKGEYCAPVPGTDEEGDPLLKDGEPVMVAECRRGAEALAALKRVLPKKPEAMLIVAETIEAIKVSNASLTDAQVRRIRAAFFTVASRGRRLAPGTSGRYARKTEPVG